MVKVKVEYIKEKPEKGWYNTSNHHHLCPFLINSDEMCVMIDKTWWKTCLLSKTCQKLEESLNSFNYKIIFSSNVVSDEKTTKHEIFWIIYNLYLHQFDAEYWISSLFNQSEYRMIKLTKDLIKFLKEQSLLFNCGRELKYRSLLQELSNDKNWQECCESIRHFNQCFVKLSQTSGKNDRKLEPISSFEQLLEFLTNSVTMLKIYEKFLETFSKNQSFDIFLIVRPWDNDIDENNEFRVFYHKNQIVAISQQKWFSPISIDFSIDQMISSLIAKIKSLVNFPYSSCVFDVYFNRKKNVVHFIEINPWGSWNAAGSSLFHWIRDETVFENSDSIVLRLFINRK